MFSTYASRLLCDNVRQYIWRLADSQEAPGIQDRRVRSEAPVMEDSSAIDEVRGEGSSPSIMRRQSCVSHLNTQRRQGNRRPPSHWRRVQGGEPAGIYEASVLGDTHVTI